MKTESEISKEYNFIYRVIRAQGFRVAFFKNKFIVTHPDTREVCFSGDIDAAKRWLIESPVPQPQLTEEEKDHRDAVQFGLVCLYLLIAFTCTTLAVMMDGNQYSTTLGAFGFAFYLLAIFRRSRKNKIS